MVGKSKLGECGSLFLGLYPKCYINITHEDPLILDLFSFPFLSHKLTKLKQLFKSVVETK